MREQRVTAVLSGGGVKAAAHLGAVRALTEAGLRPTRFVGTSLGAVMAAGLAGGVAPSEILERASGIRRRDVARLSAAALVQGLFAPALLHDEPLRETIARLVGLERFDQMTLPLTVTAADLDTGEEVRFGDGGEDAPLLDALYASCALPLWYPPAEVNGHRLADGGLRGPLPLTVAAGFEADLVVAVDAGPGFDALPSSGRLAPPAFLKAHLDALGVMMAFATTMELDLWRLSPTRPRLVYIRPEVERGATFSVGQFAGYETKGYDATRTALIRERLDG